MISADFNDYTLGSPMASIGMEVLNLSDIIKLGIWLESKRGRQASELVAMSGNFGTKTCKNIIQ